MGQDNDWFPYKYKRSIDVKEIDLEEFNEEKHSKDLLEALDRLLIAGAKVTDKIIKLANEHDLKMCLNHLIKARTLAKQGKSYEYVFYNQKYINTFLPVLFQALRQDDNIFVKLPKELLLEIISTVGYLPKNGLETATKKFSTMTDNLLLANAKSFKQNTRNFPIKHFTHKIASILEEPISQGEKADKVQHILQKYWAENKKNSHKFRLFFSKWAKIEDGIDNEFLNRHHLDEQRISRKKI